jgi:FHA domain-containing protein
MASVICHCGVVNEVGPSNSEAGQANNQDGQPTCYVCGLELPTPPPRRTVVSSEQPSEVSSPAPTPVDITCSECEASNSQDRSTCYRCGADLVPAEDAVACARLVLPGKVAVEIPYGETVTLGRHADDPSIAAALEAHDQVSRRHAEVIVNRASVKVRDLDSTNGTFVNGSRVVGETTVPVADGVLIRFGKELEIVLLPGGSS